MQYEGGLLSSEWEGLQTQILIEHKPHSPTASPSSGSNYGTYLIDVGAKCLPGPRNDREKKKSKSHGKVSTEQQPAWSN